MEMHGNFINTMFIQDLKQCHRNDWN